MRAGHLRHRAAALHPARPHPRARGRRRLLRQPRGAGLPDAASRRDCPGARTGTSGPSACSRDEPPRLPGRDRRRGTAAEEPRRRSARRFRDGVVAGLEAAGLSHGDAPAYFTPRRLAVHVHEARSIASRSSASSAAARRFRPRSTPPASRRARRPPSPNPAASRSTSSRASTTPRANSSSASTTRAGEPAAEAPARHRPGGARRAADRAAHALGRGRRASSSARCTGSSCCTATQVVAGRDPRHCRPAA